MDLHSVGIETTSARAEAMKAIACVFLLLGASSALSEEFLAERATREEACHEAVLKAKRANHTIGKSECFCDFIAARNATICTVDSSGDKHLRASSPSSSAKVPGTEFSAQGPSRDTACDAVILDARLAGYEISKFDCECKPGLPASLTACTVDSAGQKRIPSAATPKAKDRGQCPDLVRYRDTQLATALAPAFERLRHKNASRTSDVLVELEKIKKESLAARKFQNRLDVAYRLTLAAKLSADVFGDIVKIVPGTVPAATASETIRVWIERIAAGSSVISALGKGDREFETWAFMRSVKKVPGFGPALAAVHDMYEGLGALKDQKKEAELILDVLDANISRLELQIRKVDAELAMLRASNFDVALINDIQNGIASACR